MRQTELKRIGFKRVQPDSEKKPPKGIRQRSCAICKSKFTPFDSMRDKWCSVECGAALALKLVALKKAKEERAERADRKKKLGEFKPLSYWENIAEKHCNAYIRARDPDVCISCGVTNSSAWQAGHYISVGANATLRYNEDNIHKQCVQCNMHKGSNATMYRIGIESKIGTEKLAWLEGWHPTVKMTAEYAKEIAEYYKSKLRDLKQQKLRSQEYD